MKAVVFEGLYVLCVCSAEQSACIRGVGLVGGVSITRLNYVKKGLLLEVPLVTIFLSVEVYL